MSIVKEFREFLIKDNALALAIGVIIGASMGKLVGSITDDLIMPLVGLIMPANTSWKDWGVVLSHSTDPKVADGEAIPYVLSTGSLYGSPARVREQVAELAEVGVQHLLCQTGFGAMSHEQNLASMRRFGEHVMPAFRQI